MSDMTIKEIATMAGVSQAAVSRYFNDGYISEEKRNAIKQVVDETGYRPSFQAQTLRTKKTKTIGVIIPKIDSNSIGKIVDGITKVLEEHEYRMILGISRLNPEKEIEYLSILDNNQVEGILILESMHHANLRKKIAKAKVPVVVLGQQMKNCTCVYHDDYGAMKEITELCLSKGRKQIGFLGVTRQDKAVGEARWNGYHDALKEAGIAYKKKHTKEIGFSILDGYTSTKELLTEFPQMNALVCATDKIAVGAKKAIEEAGLRIPEDILLTGHGNSDLSNSVTPALTTVHFYYEECGSKAANMLFDLLEAQESRVEQLQLGYRIIEQASTQSNREECVCKKNMM